MKKDNHLSDVQLREWLRSGDPASEATPDAPAFDRIRRRMLLEIPTRRRLVTRRAFATALAMAVAFAWLSRVDQPQPDPMRRVAPTPTSEDQQTGPVRHSRQIQFVTARGTRVFWTLDEDLNP